MSGLAAWLGTGAVWSAVLDKLPPDRYTVVHGQCLGVGVGGFVLGGGVNAVGSSARYGAGAEQVVEWRLVTAAGERVSVTQEAVLLLGENGKWEELQSGDPRVGSDLWQGLRGAGAR